MPNHCHNDLYISGTSEDVAAVLALIGADRNPPEFDFNALIPYPEQFAQMDAESRAFGFGAKTTKEEQDKAREAYVAKWGHDKDGFNSGGIEWKRENWGTKWGAYDVARRDYAGVCITYQTAWSPSRQIVEALAKRFPSVTFALEYFERGGGYCGGCACPSADDYFHDDEPWHAGIVVDQWHSDEYQGCRGG